MLWIVGDINRRDHSVNRYQVVESLPQLITCLRSRGVGPLTTTNGIHDLLVKYNKAIGKVAGTKFETRSGAFIDVKMNGKV